MPGLLVALRLFPHAGRLGCIRRVRLRLGAMAGADEETLVEIVQRASFRGGGGVTVRQGLRRLLHLRLWLMLGILLVILVHFLSHFVDEPLIVFCMLQVAFRQDAVAGGGRIPRQGDVFLVDLVGRAANAHIGAVAVKILDARIDAPAALLCGIVAVIAAAIAAVIATAASTTATALRTSGVLIMSHAVLFFSLFRLNNTA